MGSALSADSCFESVEKRDVRRMEAIRSAVVNLRDTSENFSRILKNKESQIHATTNDLRTLARLRAPGAGLSPLEAIRVRALLYKKKTLLCRYERLTGLLSTIDSQIGALEDAVSTQSAMKAVKDGSRAHGQLALSIESVESILDNIREQQLNSADLANLFNDFNSADEETLKMTDADLEAELASLGPPVEAPQRREAMLA